MDDIIKYINIGVVAILALCFLIGFARATKKSVFYLIATVVFVGGGILLSNVICDGLLSMDLSSYNINIPIGEETITFTTAKDTVIEILKVTLFGDIEVETTVAYNLLLGIVHMIFRVVWTIIVIVLSFTLFKLISDIVWLFFKPKKKDRKKIKISIFSRLGGAGIGLLKGLAYVLLLFFIVAGVASVAESVNNVSESMSSEEEVALVIVDGTATLVDLSASENNNILGEYQEIIDILLSYRDTIPGKVFGTIKIDGDSLDELMFDKFFEIDVKNNNYSIKLRQELKKVANALMEFPEILDSNISDEDLFNYLKDPVKQVKIKRAIDELSSLDIINVVMPVAIEFVVLSDTLYKDASPEIKDAVSNIKIDELRNLEYGAEFANIGYAFVDVVSLLDENNEFDFFNLDPTTVENIFNSIGDLKIVEVVAPLALSYVLTLPDLVKIFEDAGVDINELGLDQIDNYGQEIKNIGVVLAKISDLGLTEEVLNDLSKLELNDEMIEKINALTEVLFQSHILKNAVPVVAKTALSALPEEYVSIINIPSDADSDYWQAELTPLLKAGIMLLSTGLLDDSDGSDILTKLKDLTDEQIDDIAFHLASSKIITNSLNGLIDQLLSAQYDEENNLIKEGVFGNVKLVGFENPSSWTKEEISSIFKAITAIIDTGLLESSDAIATIKELEDQVIDDLATDLSSSKFITNNLSPIIATLIDNLVEGAEWNYLEASEWDKEEVSSLFVSLKKIAATDLINDPNNAFTTITDEEIDDIVESICKSKFLTNNMSVVVDMLIKELTIEGVDLTTIETSDIVWNEKELGSLLKSAKMLVGNDLQSLISMSEDEMDSIVSSKLITRIIVELIKNPSADLALIKGADLVADDMWSDTISYEVPFTYASGNITIQSSSLDVTKFYIYQNGKKLVSTENNTFDLNTLVGSTISSLPTQSEITIEGYKYGEIRHMFLAIQTICGEDTINSDKIIENITKLNEENIDTLLDSIVLSETIICQIEEFSQGENSLITIPEGELTKLNADGTKDRKAWLDTETERGELFNVLNAITIVFAGRDLNTLEFTTDIITTIEESDIDIVLKSMILNDTIIVKVEEMSREVNNVIYLPSELITTSGNIDRDKWNEASETKNLLMSFKTIFSGTSVDTNNLKLKSIIDSKDEVLKSLVITETIKQNLVKTEGIDIPENEGLSLVSLDGWKNTYNDGVVSEHGELDRILVAADLILGIDDNTDFNSFNVENIKLNDLITNKDTILKSLIISNIIREKISVANGINIPSSLSGSGLAGWKNEYLANTLVSKGELSYIIEAIDKILEVNDTTTLNSIDLDNIKVANIIEQRDNVLHSLVLTETIKTQLISLNILTLPKNHQLETSNNYVKWENTYNVDLVATRGELDALLATLEDLYSSSDGSIANIEIDYSKIFEDATQQKLIKSKVLSETIIVKLVEMKESNILSIPESDLLLEEDRSAWWHQTNGELCYFLNGISDMLTPEQKKDITNFDLQIDDIYNVLVNETSRTNVLKSYVLADTVRANFLKLDAFSGSIPTETEVGVDMNRNDSWYVINSFDTGRDIEHKELWYLIDSVNILLGDTPSLNTHTFNIDEVLNNVNMKPAYTYQSGKLVYTQDNMRTFFNSLVMQKVFADVLKPVITTGGVLDGRLVEPTLYGYLYYEHGYNTAKLAAMDLPTYNEEAFTETVEFDTKTIIEAILIMNEAGLNYDTLDQFENVNSSNLSNVLQVILSINIDKLVDSFVISRSFRGSIENILNPVFKDVYGLVYTAGLIGGTPIDQWDNVKLNNSDYAYPMSKYDAKELLKTNINTIIDNMKTVFPIA